MGGLGTREWAGLGLLLVAAFIAATFLDAGARGQIPPRTPFIVTPLPSPSIAATPTATQVPPTVVEIPDGSWMVEYYNGDEAVASTVTFVETLDLDHPTAPFGEFAADDWRLEARTDLDLGAGQQTFTLLHDGELQVLVNGEQVARDNDPADGPRTLTVVFPFEGGRASIRVIATDSGGPLLVRWVE